MPFDPTLAATRFGIGLSPDLAAPTSVSDIMTQLRGPDHGAQAFEIPKFADVTPHVSTYLRLHRARVQARGTDQEQATQEAFQELRSQGRAVRERHFRATLARWTHNPDGFRERLAAFWGDHFTVVSRNGQTAHMVQPYIEEAIRPHLTGSFSQMLRACILHPMMLRYLDQIRSMGPNSPAALERGAGLNENLAREVLELHTLGVDGPYTQHDVRQLAELFTGLSYNPSKGFVFRPPFAEPGAETVLGQDYGGGAAALDPILQVLDDLATHPATARHIAQKLAVHFVSDTPSDRLVSDLEHVFNQTGGDLGQMYEAMLNHPESWSPDPVKIRQPFEYICASMRALAVPADRILGLTRQEILRGFYHPMQLMGQTWQHPLGPDGWPEEPLAWITPRGMAARINWAMNVPQFLNNTLPDPRDFVKTALGKYAPQEVVFAANSAEARSEGIGLVLASAAFNKR